MSLTETRTAIAMEHRPITIVMMLLYISSITYSPTYSAPAVPSREFLTRHMASRDELLAKERERMIGGKIQLTIKEQKVSLIIRFTTGYIEKVDSHMFVCFK